MNLFKRAIVTSDQSASASLRAPVDIPPMPRPTPIPATTTALDRYEAVAAKIGFAPQELRDERARRLLASIDVPTYNPDAVRAYMDAQVAKLRPPVDPNSPHLDWGWYWRWTPLRDADVTSNPQQQFPQRGYSMPVPLRVLERVAAVLEVAPEAKFYVSVIERRPKGDPFLAVSIDGSDVLVIDQWDEPGFTG